MRYGHWFQTTVNVWYQTVTVTVCHSAPVNVKPQGRGGRIYPGDLTKYPFLWEGLLTQNDCPQTIKYSKCMTNLTKSVVPGMGNLTKLVSKVSNPPGYALPPTLGLNIDWCINCSICISTRWNSMSQITVTVKCNSVSQITAYVWDQTVFHSKCIRSNSVLQNTTNVWDQTATACHKLYFHGHFQKKRERDIPSNFTNHQSNQ